MRDINELWVVFVDDDQRVLDAIGREMKRVRPGWNCFFAGSALEAIEIVNVHIKDIDVMVCDINMPGLSGLDALRIAKQLFPRLLRVALSGHIDVYTLLESEKISHLHLCKPVDAQKISNGIIAAYKVREIPKMVT